MKPGRELDALIAEKVMGLKVVHKIWNKGRCQSFTIGEPDYSYTSDIPEGYLTNMVPEYSTNIAAAWEVVEKCGISVIQLGGNEGYLAYYGFMPFIGGMIEIHIYPNNERPEWHYQIGETAPHAICLAALKAIKP